MTLEELHIIISGMQNNRELFKPEIHGFPIWCLIKNRLYFYFLNKHFTKENKNSIYQIYKRLSAFSFQLVNVPASRISWFFRKFSINGSERNKSIVLLEDGFFRYKKDTFYQYPFGEDLFDSEDKNFTIFSVERNNRIKRKGNILHKPDIREDFTNFIIPFRLLSGIKDRQTERIKDEIKNILCKELAGYPELAEDVSAALDSKIMNRILYTFKTEKDRAYNILNRLKPSCLLLTASYGHFGWVAACKELKIKVIEYQHGVIIDKQPMYDWPLYYSDNKEKLLVPDELFLWGEYWKSNIEKMGFWRSNELHPFGYSKISFNENTGVKEIKAENKKAKFVYTSSYPVKNESIDFFDRFLDSSARANADVTLYIKMHPDENDHYKYYRVLQDKYPERCRIFLHEEKSLYDLFLESDVHLSVYSAAIFESVKLGTPTGILRLPGSEVFEDLAENGTLRLINSYEELMYWAICICSDTDEWRSWKEDTETRREYFFSDYRTGNFVELLNNLEKRA